MIANNKEKHKLRAHFRALRKKIPMTRKNQASQEAVKVLYEVTKKFPAVLSFASKDDEINLSPLNEKLALENRLLLPKIEKNTLTAYFVKDLEKEIVLNPQYLFFEPFSEFCKKAKIEQISCALIPGLAFDKDNHRIGYGKGFYDIFLRFTPSCHTIGIGYREQLSIKNIPAEAHDVQLLEKYLF